MEVVLESLKCEVIVVVWLCAYPSFVRLILCWLCALPLSVEVVFVGERSCVLSIVIAPNPQWSFPVWEVLCRRVSKNPSV